MKNKVLYLIFIITSLFYTILNVNAATAPSSLKTTGLTTTTQYVPGAPTVYLKETTTGVDLYCEQALMSYPKNLTINLKGEVAKGFIYILNSKPNTGNAAKDYYIKQIAVWWFKDVWNGTSNISQSVKNTITNGRTTNDVYNKIYNLVEGAKNYTEPKAIISVNGKNNFTLKNGNYVSDTIKVSTYYTNSYNVELVNAPRNAKIINKTSTSFQVSVPESWIKEGSTVSFKVKISSNYTQNSVYEYYYNSNYQNVIYDKVFSTTHTSSETLNLSIYREKEDYNRLTIYKVDEDSDYVSGAKLSLYIGNCVNTTCNSNNLKSSWTTTTSPKYFENIATGYYTLVETSAPAGYKLADKMLINVKSLNGIYNVKMVDEKILDTKVKISKTDVTGSSEIPGATLILKDSNGKQVDKWVSESTAHYVQLAPGVYTLTELIAPSGYKLSSETITFKVDEDNNVYEKVNNNYVKVSSIKMVNEKILDTKVKISKTDVTGSSEIPGATLILKDSNGKQVDKWVSESTAHYVQLAPGVYTLTELIAPSGYKLSSETITFKVDEDNNVYEKINNNYVKVSSIKMVNELIEQKSIKINKLDADTNEFVEGAVLMIKTTNDIVVETLKTYKESIYIKLEAGEYYLEEAAAPEGYELNNTKIYFTVDAEGNIKIKNENGEYVNSADITIYNKKEKQEVVVVPPTGLSSTFTYIMGASVLLGGAFVLKKHVKEN